MALYRLFYGRVSSKDQNLDLQLAQAQEFGFDQIFSEHITGRRQDRPEFNNLIAKALELRQQGHQVEVWVVEWSRWARNTAFSMEKVRELEAAGVVIMELTTRQPMTLSTASGLITTGTKSLMAEYYSIELKERVERSIAQRKKLNKPIGPTVALGYQRSADKSRLEPGPEWQIARELIEKFVAGESIHALMRWLWETHGIHRGRSSLWAWLKSPTIRGHLVYDRGKDIRYNTHPPLLSESEARQIDYRMELNRQMKGRNARGTFYAVPNFVWCAECGRRMDSWSDKRRRYFLCNHSRRRGDCGNRLRINQLNVETAIQKAFMEAAAKIATDLNQINTVDPAIAALEAERAALKPLAHRPAIAEEIAAIDAEIANRRAGHQRQDISHLQDVIKTFSNLNESDWKQLSQVKRRAIYSELVENLFVLEGQVTKVKLKI